MLTFNVTLPDPDAKAVLGAAEEGDLEKLKKLLGKNPLLLQCTDKDGYTPLHRACYGNNVKVVEVMREKELLPSLRQVYRAMLDNRRLQSAQHFCAHGCICLLLGIAR